MKVSSTDPDRRQVLAALSALALGCGFAPGRAQEAASLRFLDCHGARAGTALARFTTESGFAVSLDTCADAPTLYAGILGDNANACDLIVPPDRYVARMIFANLLLPIDRSLVPNLRNIDPAFANAAFDPGRRHSVGYRWGTLGIGYRRSAVEVEPDSWKWILDSDRHAGRIGLLDDPQLTLQVALKYLGTSINTVDPAQIEAAAALLRRQRPYVARFSAVATEELLLAGEIDLTLAWNGDIARAKQRDPDIGYVVPREGTVLWQDCLCIPRAAAHPREAHALIDFLLRADVGAQIALASLYATPNAAARAALPETYGADPAIYPSADVLGRAEIAAYRGERVIQLYERAWNSVRAG